jgi:hypothetical protein
MEIDLKKVQTYFINLPQHTEKRDSVYAMLGSLNIENVQRLEGSIYPENPVAGCSRAHYHSLDPHKVPFLLLEDDVFLLEDTWNDGIINVPDDADAVFLGTSTWGRMNGHNGEYVQYDAVEGYPGLLRIYNMLSAHAILYIGQEYTSMIKRAAYYAGYVIEDYNDVLFAELQRFFNVYAFDRPIFGQTSNQLASTSQITSINHTSCMNINPLQFYPYQLK